MQKQIAWESKHFTFNKIYSGLEKEEGVPVTEQAPYEDEFEEEVPVQNLMATPFGLWNVDDSMNPFREFKFWMGHTNFSIGRNAQAVMKRIPGVEVLKVLTRYRFIIGVGKLYNIRDVRVRVEMALCGTSYDKCIEEN